MKLIMKGRNNSYDALCEYDSNKETFTVLKNSRVKLKPSFENLAVPVKKYRDDKTIVDKNGIVLKNIEFKSASTAAQFICGQSSNGLRTWKNENGISLKEIKKK